jgi:gliding motility-associated-like protein
MPTGTSTGNTAGRFTITSTGGSAPNYTFRPVTAFLTVNKAPLTIAVENKTRAYGDPNGTFTAVYSSFVNGDTPASLTKQPTFTTAANASSVVGTYPVTAGGATSVNYNITYTLGTLTVDKTKLIVKADDKSVVYGAAIPAYTVTYNGFKNGDNETSLTTPATATASAAPGAGTYDITPSGATTDSRYDIEYIKGILTINKANLTVTAQNTTRVYGETNPTFNAVYSGFVNGETQAVINTPATGSTTATTASGVNNYTIDFTGAADDNYNFGYVPATLSVTPTALTITANNQSRRYGEANASFTALFDGFVNGDTEASLSTPLQYATTANQLSGIGTYPLTVSGATSGNYTIAFNPGAITIGRTPLRVTANNAIRNFDEANPALTLAYNGFVNGENENILNTKPTATTAANTSSPVGTYPIVVAGGVSDNYALSYTNGTLTVGEVSKPTLLITAKPATRAYGVTNPAFEVTYSGFVNGDTEANVTTKPQFDTDADLNSGVGTYNIRPKNAVSAKYNITYANGELTITKAELTARADNKIKVYGDANPAFSVSYTGFVNGETAAVLNSPSTAIVTAGVNALTSPGTYTITASGGSAANYNIAPASGTLTISQAPLRVTANNAIRNFGEANPALTVTYSGFVNGENENNISTKPTATTVANTSSPVGTYAIVAAGGVSDNYTFDYTGGTLTVGEISKPTLLITAKPATRAYGAADPAFEVTYSGFVNGDTEASMTTRPTFTTNATATSGMGLYTIVPKNAVNNNYNITYANSELTITKAGLIARADNKAKVYGDANPAFSVSYTGFVNGETVAVLTSASTASATGVTAASSAGNYPITASGGSANNYQLSYSPGTLTITKAPLTVTANNAIREFGVANPAFTVAYNGFVNGDNVNNLTTRPTVTTAANASSPVGTYPIVAAGGVSANYTFSYTDGTLTVGKPVLTITAKPATRAYGAADPAFEVTYSGFVNGDTETSMTTKPTFTTNATATSGTGLYVITPNGAVNNNYSLVYNTNTLTITKAQLTAKADNKSKAYGGANPTFTVAYTGFANGETASVLNSPSVASVAAAVNAATVPGNYIITASGGSAANYDISYTPGTLTINKAALSVIADNKSKVYGSANPAFTFAYSGFVNGESAAVLTATPTASVAMGVTAASGAGNYAITPVGGSAANYTLVYVPGTLTINKATLTVTADNATRAFGAVGPAFTVAYSGFVNGDTPASLTTQASGSTVATSASVAGTYPIAPVGATSPNYTFNYVNGVLTITPGTAVISFAVIPLKTFGNPDFDPAATTNVGEPVIYTSSNPAVATIVNNKVRIVGAGTTILTASISSTSGYSLTVPVTKSLEIYKASQSISFNNIPVIDRGGSYSLSNVTASSGLPVTLTINDNKIASIQGTTLSGVQIGNTTITATQPGNNNYLPANFVIQQVVVGPAAGQLEVQVHQAVSPNGDGINDVFLIEGITNHPDNRVTLINRNGLKVYEVMGYDNVNRVFNGRSNVTGNLLQQGTYFYQIQYIVNGKGRNLTGFFVLKY